VRADSPRPAPDDVEVVRAPLTASALGRAFAGADDLDVIGRGPRGVRAHDRADPVSAGGEMGQEIPPDEPRGAGHRDQPAHPIAF
jgi:hypothetical protein